MKSISLERLLNEFEYINKRLKGLESTRLLGVKNSIEYYILTGKQLMLKQLLIEAGYYDKKRD